MLLSSPAFAGDWSSSDTATESAWQTINLIDWGQTLDIADKCRTTSIHERNPMLRRCPKFSEVNKHFAIGALLHYGVSKTLSGKYRAGFQWVTIGYGLQIIGDNAHLGLKVNF